MRIHLAAAIAAALAVTGCAELTSIYRSAPLSGPDGKVVLIDAKQRVVSTTRTESGDVTCAEPSPDALTVFAASFAGTLSVPDKGSAQVAASLNETGANIGLRTPSIQLLRDVMYRICEGYSSGAIDGPTFATLHRRYQNIMIGLLAIEQLTGATRPAVIAIGGAARADVGDDVVQAQRNLDAAKLDEQKKKAATEEKKEAVQKASDDLTKKKAALDELNKKTPKPADAEIQAAQNSVNESQKSKDKADAELKDTEAAAKQSTENREAVELKLKAAVSGSSAASSSFGLPNTTQISQPPSAQAATEVAKAVETIVKSIVEADYSPDTCQTIVLDAKYIGSNVDGVKKAYDACLKFITAKAEEQTKEKEIRNEHLQQNLDNLKTQRLLNFQALQKKQRGDG